MAWNFVDSVEIASFVWGLTPIPSFPRRRGTSKHQRRRGVFANVLKADRGEGVAKNNDNSNKS